VACTVAQALVLSLLSQETLLYAPMSNVGTVLYDKDAVYIDMPQIHFTKLDDVEDWGSDGEAAKEATDAIASSGEGVKLVKSLQQLSEGLDDKMSSAQFKLFKHSAAVAGADVASDSDSPDDDGSDEEDGTSVDSASEGSEGLEGSDDDGDGSVSSHADSSDEADNTDSSEDSNEEHTKEGHSARWKSGLAEKAAAAFRARCDPNKNLGRFDVAANPLEFVLLRFFLLQTTRQLVVDGSSVWCHTRRPE
jgi:ribosome biogenesis protein BMS1